MVAIKCPLSDHWMPVITTKRGKPFLYCGHCRYGFMLLAKPSMEALNKSCQEISESQLDPETRKWYRKKKYGEETEE